METIPVWDAFEAHSECALCLLQRKAEKEFVAFFLGSSVMAPEMRVQVNQTGFCPPHFSMLLSGGNRLGLALMTHTHLRELRKDMDHKLRLASTVKANKKRVADLDELITGHLGSCLICERLDERFKRYAFTIAYLWQRDSEFRGTFVASHGFCIDHLRGLLWMARETLSPTLLPPFASELSDIQDRAWDRLDSELLAFTGTFDHAAQVATASSGDRLARSVAAAIQKLTGADVSSD